MTDDERKNLQKVDSGSPGNLPADTSIALTQKEVLDLTGLSREQISELKYQHAAGMIDIKKKAEELSVDVGALDAALGSFVDQTAKATQAGASATITHTQTTSLGRTEVVIGNTVRALKGKLSRSAIGGEDRTLWIVGIIAVVAVVVALIVGTR